MGRMLDTLKNGEHGRSQQGHAGQAPGSDCVVDWAPHEVDEVPFIEVGAPGKKVEGSPQVLAVKHPAQPKQPPHPPTEKALVAAKVVELAETKPLSVAFEPYGNSRPTRKGIAAEVIVYHQPEHAVSKQYAALLGRLVETCKDQQGMLLLLVGVRPQVGVSTVLANLAVAATKTHQRLVLVDAHPARPSQAERFGLDATAGLVEVIEGGVALEQAVVPTKAAGLYLLPARGWANTAKTALTAEAARWLAGWLRQRFEMVLVDGPALDDGLHLGMLAGVGDGLFVVAPREETQLMNSGLAQTIARLGGRLRGLIHTQFEP